MLQLRKHATKYPQKSNCNCSIIIYCKQLFTVTKNVLNDLYHKRNDYKTPHTKQQEFMQPLSWGIGKMRKCGMQNAESKIQYSRHVQSTFNMTLPVKCGMKSAECTCGMVRRMRKACNQGVLYCLFFCSCWQH